jgi:glycine cleavage system transcriptional repressor
VDIPETADHKLLEAELRQKAAALDLQISIQHRRIFEAINRI